MDDPGILLTATGGGTKTHSISVCGNHFLKNDGASSATSGAQVRFSGNVGDVSFCGNVYDAQSQATGQPMVPAYAYDVTSGSTLGKITLYESPTIQVTGVFSPGATAAGLNADQVCPAGVVGPC